MATDDKSINLVEKAEPELKPAEEKKPMKRSNSFSRRGKGAKKTDDVKGDTGAKLATGSGGAATGTGAADATAEEDPAEAMKAKNEFKIGEQGDPLLEQIQQQAEQYAQEGMYDEAGEEFHNLAQAYHQKGDKVRECAAWQNMALCLEYLAEGSYSAEQARAIYHNALECYESALALVPEDEEGSEANAAQRSELFEKLFSLCQAAGYQDDYQYGPSALKELQKLSIAFRAKDTVEHKDIVECYLRSSRLLSQMKDWKEAIVRLMAALELTPKISEDETRIKLERDVRYHLGVVHHHSESKEDSIKNFKLALKLAEQIDDTKSVLTIHNILGDILVVPGATNKELDEAVEQLQLAVPVAEKLEDLQNVGRSYLQICQAHRMQGEPRLPEAVKAAEHALTVAEKMHAESKEGIWEAIADCNTRLAAAHVAAGQHEKSLSYLRKAAEIWEGTCLTYKEELRRRRSGELFPDEDALVSDDPSTVGLMDEKNDTAVLLVQALLATEPKDSLESLFAAEAARCTALRAIIDLTENANDEEDEDAIQDISDPDPATAVADAGKPAATGSPAPALINTPEQVKELMSHVVDSDGNGTLLYYAYLESEPERQGVVQPDAKAPTDEVCLWVIGPSGTVQAVQKMPVVVKGGEPIVDLYRNMTLKAAAELQKKVTRGHLPDVSEMIKEKDLPGLEADGGPISFASELSALSELLLTPALPYLKTGVPVAIVTDYLLQVLPFGAMPLADGTALIEAHAIISAPSLTVLRQLIARGMGTALDATKESLVVAGAEPQEKYCEQFELTALPAAVAEATRVSDAIKSSVLTGKDATAYAVAIALRDKNLRCVHISSHVIDESFLLSPNQEHSESYKAAEAAMTELIAKGVAEDSQEFVTARRALEYFKRQEEQDILGAGVLSPPTMAQLPSWRGRPTVVLTGSSGSMGKVSHDSLQGMPRAMLCSGARSVLASMWETEDAAAAHLATAFYEAITVEPSITQAEALRRAIKSTREADGGKWSSPAYWAGFNLIGGTACGI